MTNYLTNRFLLLFCLSKIKVTKQKDSTNKDFFTLHKLIVTQGSGLPTSQKLRAVAAPPAAPILKNSLRVSLEK